MKRRSRLRSLAEALLRCIWELQDRPWKGWLNLDTGDGTRFSFHDDHRHHDPRPGAAGGRGPLSYREILQAGYARLLYDGTAYVTVLETTTDALQSVREYLLRYCSPYTKVVWEEQGGRGAREMVLQNMGRPYQSRVAAFR